MACQVVYGHRVLKEKPKGCDLNSANKVTLAQFLSLVDRFSRFEYDDFAKGCAEKKALTHQSSKEILFPTFDDGYIDVKESVYPILAKKEIPFILFVTTGFLDQTAYPYEEQLATLVQELDQIKTFEAGIFQTDDEIQKEKAYSKLRLLFKRRSISERTRFIEKTYRINGLDPESSIRPMFLSWEDVVDMAQNPLVSIGSHTLSHAYLPCLPWKQAWFEIFRSKSLIEKKLNKRIDCFSFPYGACNPITLLLSKMAGYRHVFTTDHRPLPGLFLAKTGIPRTDIQKLIRKPAT